MNTELMTALQTFIAGIGMSGRFVAPKSQDPADKTLHEYLVADTIRALGVKRYDAAKDSLIDVIGGDKLGHILRQTEATNATYAEEVLRTGNYACTVKMNGPSTGKVDATLLMNELVRAGVDPEVIRTAASKSMKYQKANTYYTVVPTRSRA